MSQSKQRTFLSDDYGGMESPFLEARFPPERHPSGLPIIAGRNCSPTVLYLHTERT